jgi:hypothetical protein
MATAETTATNPIAATPTASEPAKWVYDEDRYFFGPNESDKAVEMAQKIADSGTKVIQLEGDWPVGAGFAILPIARNETVKTTVDGKVEEITKRKLHAVLLWPFYGLDSLQTAQGGADYVSQVVQADQAARILNPLRRQRWEKGEFDISSCPKLISEHIEGMAGDRGVIKPYLEAAKELLPVLKEKYPKVFGSFTPALLRTFLQSKAAATAFSAQLETKGLFVQIIGKLESITAKAGGNVEIYQRWRETREQDEAINVDDVSLDSLSI